MLTTCNHITHSANDLHSHIKGYLNKIRLLKTTDSFEEKLCDKRLRKYLGKNSEGEVKKLHALFDTFHSSFLALDKDKRDLFIQIFNETNKYPWALNNPGSVRKKAKYPGETGKTSHALFLELYESTLGNGEYDVKAHYLKLYDLKSDAWCPFCGLEKYKEPETVKQDYDHLLCKSKYPLAAVNMENLIPMCIDCNRYYKVDKDVLELKKDVFNKMAHPYHETIAPRISLKGSVSNSDPEKRVWNIQVLPKIEKVETWNTVFEMSIRCSNALQKRENSSQTTEYDEEISRVVRSLKSAAYGLGHDSNWSILKLKKSLTRLKFGMKHQLYEDKNLFRSGIYDYLINHADGTYLRSIVAMLNYKDDFVEDE